MTRGFLEYSPASVIPALSRTGAGLFFEVCSQRFGQGSTLTDTKLAFDRWTGVFGPERLT